ncbi:MAG: hypothetical protein HKM06_02080 [Spirochaetales bacterium]|nr:hypothetical protein [Spirochaetales bacterium]
MSTLQESHGKWTLLVDGKPYFVKGVTFGIAYTQKNIDLYMDQLVHLGCNTVRTWGVGADTQMLMDSAQRHGIKVMLGLWLRHGKAGMEGDDAFDWVNDTAGREAQWTDTLEAVRKYKDDPALLMWGVGNEVILNIGTEKAKIAYAKFLEKLCLAIKKIDPNHLIASASAWTVDAAYWAKYDPAIDVYGLNVYGAGAAVVDKAVEKLGVDKPYLLTEFGAQGEWEVPKDSNGLPIEPSDQEKYSTIATGWTKWVENKPTCLGGFVFNFGNGWDHGAVWLSLMMKDYKRPMYWATLKAFTGKSPAVKPVMITQYEIQKNSAKPGDWVPISVATSGPSSGLQVSMYFNDRTGVREHRDAIFPLKIKGNLSSGIDFQVPKILGVLKIYVFISDEQKNLAIAQKSFVVTDGSGKVLTAAKKSGVLPLVVYDDDPRITGVEEPFVASGMMGNYDSLTLDLGSTDHPEDGQTCLKVSYNAYVGWVGCAWQTPANNWGTMPGGYNLTGAKTLSFWARGTTGEEKVSFGYGMIDSNAKYYDSSKKGTGDFYLTRHWKKYTIDLSGQNMSNIITGFYFFTSSNGVPVTFYLDDIEYN